ncbi:MAG: glycoside hydrolase family 127 protein, partial [Lachnospiraceae bacterium]|nr:glycoside hydrolase family 127 protein [Lachnospiraceae bacterium]
MTAGAFAVEGDADYPIHPVPFTKVRFTSGVLAERQDVNRKVTIPFALQQCIESNRLKNFDLAAETMKRRAAGETTFQNRPASSLPFEDTDIYKFLEGASYSLQTNPDPELRKKMEDIIQHVKAAQEPDGYLYTFRTMHPDSPAHEWID